MYNEIYLKNRLKSYESRIITNSHGNGMPKELSHITSLSIILIEFVFKECLLKRRKYIVKERKMKG